MVRQWPIGQQQVILVYHAILTLCIIQCATLHSPHLPYPCILTKLPCIFRRIAMLTNDPDGTFAWQRYDNPIMKRRCAIHESFTHNVEAKTKEKMIGMNVWLILDGHT